MDFLNWVGDRFDGVVDGWSSTREAQYNAETAAFQKELTGSNAVNPVSPGGFGPDSKAFWPVVIGGAALLFFAVK